MIKKLISQYVNKYRSFIKFIVVGSLSTSLDLCIYIVLSNTIDITISKLISTTIACISSLLLNKTWTFQYGEDISVVLILKYTISQIFNILFNVTTNTLIYKVTKLKIVAFIIATLFAMILNFLLQKYYVFKTKEDS